MTTVRALLDEIREASAGVPDPDAEPEAVLDAVEQMMVRREPAFAALQAELARGVERDDETRAAAEALSALDQRWKARMDAALKTLAGRLDGARKLRTARPRAPAVHYVSLDV